MLQPQIALLISFDCLLFESILPFVTATLDLVTVIIELLTVLLDYVYLDIFDRFVQSAAVEASLSPQMPI